MQIPNSLPQFIGERVLLVVSAKEHGRLYQAYDGMLEEVVNVEEHPETTSDREGFFARSGYGQRFGSGSPEEFNKQETIRTFVKSIAQELNEAMKDLHPNALYLFQPEHLKGYLEHEIKNPDHIPVHAVAYGNFVDEKPLRLLEHVAAFHNDAHDATDPSSVADGPDAEEKRRLLAVGQKK